tara:strand:+ start:2509 stop:2625 length:117 start_codon:yes stop_codon:yes gene_type:complete
MRNIISNRKKARNKLLKGLRSFKKGLKNERHELFFSLY